MKFDLSTAWNDTIALLSEHKQLLIPLAGVFYFLPEVLSALFVAQPEMESVETLAEMVDVISENLAANWPMMLILGLITTIGSLAILWLVTGTKGKSVGDAIKVGLICLIPAFIASLITSFAVGIGFVFLIIPGLYLLGRFSLAAVSIVAEEIRNPLAAIGRSWELTKGNGWRVTLFLLVVAVVGLVLMLIVQGVFGLVFNAILGGETAATALAFVGALFSAAFTSVFVLMAAAIYRQLAGHSAKNTSVFAD